MARLNPRRRLLAKQGAILAQARIARALEGDDSKLLQQGSPVSSLKTYATRVAMRGPNFKPLEAKAPAWYLNGAKPTYQGNKGVLPAHKARKGDFQG